MNQVAGLKQRMAWRIALCSVCSVCFLGAFAALAHEPVVTAENEKSNQGLGLQQRELWTSSRVKGIPDPPAPFKLQRAYEGIDIPNLIALNAVPRSSVLLAVDHEKAWGGPSRILQFADQPDAKESSLFLELPDIIYGLAFHPDFADNGLVFIGCNGRSDELDTKATKVLQFRVQCSEDGRYRCVRESMQVIIEWPSNGHNGGDLAFGNDGMLYVSAGDGTSDSDTNRTGQDLSRIPGSMLRIEVDRTESGRKYGIPQDNPFVGVPDARPEIWAYGLRNPWRISFDPKSNQLWVGNNGQDLWESVYLIEKGANYGWSIKESNHPFHEGQDSGPVAISPATTEHHHSEARSLTGGHVYRGSDHPELVGEYVYGDFSTGNIWAVRPSDEGPSMPRLIARSRAQITGFGRDSRGELLVADHVGGIYRLVPNTEARNSEFPKLLSQTGLFDDVARQQPAAGVIPYSVISPLWSDGAVKQRWLAVPGNETIGYKTRGSWDFPEGSVLVKSFAFPQPDGENRLVETRLMTKHEGEWYGYSYRWNDEQTDAALVSAEGFDEELPWVASNHAESGLNWRYPSRTECMVCHSRAANFVLGLSTEQMLREQIYNATDGEEILAPQIETLAHIGMFGDDPELGIENAESLVSPADETAALSDRARSYLHANCSSCHMNAGGGNARINLIKFPELANTKLTNTDPLHGDLGRPTAKLLAPGNADDSLLFMRMARRGKGQMPPLASNLLDEVGVALIRDWINSLGEPHDSE